MTNVDQFESVFRSAAKEVFQYRRIEVASALIVTDLEPDEAYEYGEQIKSFLKVLNLDDAMTWDLVTRSEFDSIERLLELVGERNPGLLCTYRHLHSTQWRQPRSLGDYVEVLTQATPIPVLVLPHPRAKRAAAHAMLNTNVVMAMTNHLTGDHRLVNYATRFTEADGVLFLTHIEDEKTFDRYIDVISKIPGIDTDQARERIGEQLLKEPRDYIQSCREAIGRHLPTIHVEDIVSMGHHLTLYHRFVEEHEVDLLVMKTKDQDQLAMHGMAYALAVELRQIPLLML